MKTIDQHSMRSILTADGNRIELVNVVVNSYPFVELTIAGREGSVLLSASDVEVLVRDLEEELALVREKGEMPD